MLIYCCCLFYPPSCEVLAPDLVTHEPAGAPALSSGSLSPMQPAHVYHRLPQTLPPERDCPGRGAPQVPLRQPHATNPLLPGLPPLRKTTAATNSSPLKNNHGNGPSPPDNSNKGNENHSNVPPTPPQQQQQCTPVPLTRTTMATRKKNSSTNLVSHFVCS